jgi:hypothetical protein
MFAASYSGSILAKRRTLHTLLLLLVVHCLLSFNLGPTHSQTLRNT